LNSGRVVERQALLIGLFGVGNRGGGDADNDAARGRDTAEDEEEPEEEVEADDLLPPARLIHDYGEVETVLAGWHAEQAGAVCCVCLLVVYPPHYHPTFAPCMPWHRAAHCDCFLVVYPFHYHPSQAAQVHFSAQRKHVL